MTDKDRRATLLLLCAAALAACGGGDSPEAQIRARIDAMEAAVEARRPADFVEHLTQDFAGERGQLDRQGMRMFLAGQLLGNERVEVVLGPIDVKLHDGDRATVTLSAVVTGGRLLPERGEALSVVSGWRLEDGEWRCYRADRTDE